MDRFIYYGKNKHCYRRSKEKIDRLKEMGVNPYPAGYQFDLKAIEAIEKFGEIPGEELEKDESEYSLAGRIMSMRVFGKAAFIHIKDSTGMIQSYVRKDKVGDEGYQLFN